MKQDELLKMVDICDVPESYRPIVELVGLNNFLKLCRYASGDEIYFPMQKSILKNTRKRLIQKEFNGCNALELSRKYDISLKRVKSFSQAPKSN